MHSGARAHVRVLASNLFDACKSSCCVHTRLKGSRLNGVFSLVLLFKRLESKSSQVDYSVMSLKDHDDVARQRRMSVPSNVCRSIAL